MATIPYNNWATTITFESRISTDQEKKKKTNRRLILKFTKGSIILKYSLNFIIYNMHNIYSYKFFLNFFILNIKTLNIFFKIFSG
jgi:hypothetical protein